MWKQKETEFKLFWFPPWLLLFSFGNYTSAPNSLFQKLQNFFFFYSVIRDSKEGRYLYLSKFPISLVHKEIIYLETKCATTIIILMFDFVWESISSNDIAKTWKKPKFPINIHTCDLPITCSNSLQLKSRNLLTEIVTKLGGLYMMLSFTIGRHKHNFPTEISS